MILSPSKFLQRSFLRELQQNYYVSRGGKEYFPDLVDELLAEKEQRLALIEYNEALKAHARHAENSGINKGLPPDLSSNDAGKLFCADTIFPLKEVQKGCFDDRSTPRAPASGREVRARQGALGSTSPTRLGSVWIGEKKQRAGAGKLAPVKMGERQMQKFTYKNHTTVKVLHADYSLKQIRADLKRSQERVERISRLIKSAGRK